MHRVVRSGLVLYACSPGRVYRRKRGKWYMRGHTGRWFRCNIHSAPLRCMAQDYAERERLALASVDARR